MEDYKIILYILAAVAYFVITQWRKAFKSPNKREDQVENLPRPKQQARPAQPVTSFEDILRELQPKAEQAKETVKPMVKQAQEFVQEKVLPPLAPAANKYNTYEDKPARALSWEKPAEAMEAAKQSRLRQKIAFAPSDVGRVVKPNRYAEMLSKPGSARDAFVLSEIFNRKYK
ncbi:hypothetical protein [Pontibacter akesuensis]|uniref:Uncharacterized protein n=1 Tax=Pontibacter akesuensis TaxID=388950 RepID=A0A1I7G6F3_9BACT|nr:hypothetical protein [Pontibacter akesuensis]GHA58523.1 hypothetical protein GCM10007389_08060 [Pontibacter akesuensis]SFU44027.1 hypothetical protein SAMN04487941_0758 [Pontibacter akesuensis]